MKKFLFLLLALATLFSFVGCSDPNGPDTDNSGSNGAGGNGTGPDDTGGNGSGGNGPDTDDITPIELNILAGYENTQYNCLYFAQIPEKSGYTDFNIEFKYESETGNQCNAKLRGEFENDASGSISGSTDYQKSSVKCLGGQPYDDWSTGSKVEKKCADSAYKIEFCIQDSSWQAVAGKVYVKKAWLSGKGKDDLVLDLKTQPVGELPVRLDIIGGYENAQLNCLYFAPISEGSGYTDFNIEYTFESNTGTGCNAKLRGDDANDASAGVAGNKGSYQKGTAKCLGGQSYDDWSTGSKVQKECADSAYKIEFCIQDAGWQAVAGIVYVKKAWLSGTGKEDLVLKLSNSPVSPE